MAVRGTIIVEFSPTTAPAATPAWVDVSSYVRDDDGITTRRGRTNELDKFDTGQASITLDNRDRRFDPTYTGGTYYPNVLRMRRMRARVGYGGTTYNLFSGFVNGWPQGWPDDTFNDAKVTVPLVDGFAVLALAELTNQVYASELSSTRVTNVLDAAGWSSADRNIRTGKSTMVAGTIDGTTAQAHLQSVVYSENGRLFVDAGGTIAFHDRHASMEVTQYSTSQATFGDGTGELAYSSLALSDDSLLWTQCKATPSGGTAEVVTSSAGTTNYYVRTLKRDSLLISSQSEALDSAQWNVHLYDGTTLSIRVESMTFPPDLSPSHWLQALSREIGDRITVRKRPPGGGTIEQASIIEGIEHRITRDSWATTWRLSPADPFDYWVLGQGVLGSTTRFAY